MFEERYIHEVVITKNGTILLVDVCNTPDCDWEGAFAIFDEDTFRAAWENVDDTGEYSIEDIKTWGEEFDAFNGWEVVSSHHRTPEAAEKKLRKYIANL